MTTATASVFGFKGTAYWGRPGYDFRPDQVREDFGQWRAAQSRDGKRIAAWLVRNGYRMAWRKIGRGADAVAYEEYWVKVDVLGGPEVRYGEPRDIRAAFEALQPQRSVATASGYRSGMFRWCGYWRTWSYIVSVDGFTVREFSVTPINGNWQDKGFFRLREHRTAWGEGDRLVAQLPEDVLASIETHMGAGWVDRMIVQYAGGREAAHA